MVDALRRRRANAAGRAPTVTAGDEQREQDEAPTLDAVLDRFWCSGPELAELHVSLLAGEAPGAFLRQLGPVPSGSGARNPVEVLAPLYVRLAAAAERRALSD